MFGWFRKKEKRVDAYELGRRMAESTDADMEAFMRARLYPSIQNIGSVVFGEFESPDVPPFVVARIDLKNFLDHLDDYFRPVLPQMRSAMAEWINLAAEGGVSAEIERIIEHHYNELKAPAALTPFQNLLDMTDTLKEADDRWRAANPEKAAKIPFDALGPELGDVLEPYLKARPRD